MKQVRVGLIGYGLSGSVFQAPLINAVDGLVLAKAVSSAAGKVKKDYPQVEVVESVETLLTDTAIDLVVVSSPNPTHYLYAKQALEANKHVVVEKPFVNTLAQADELIALAAKKKRVLSVFQNRRWDNDFLTVKKCIQEGLFGDVSLYEAHFDFFRPQVGPKWKEHTGEGSGALYDLGPHLIDQALFLFGLPKTVSCELVKQRPGAEVDDFFHLVLGYEKLRVVLQSSSITKKAGPHFQVHGNKGSMIKFGMDPQQADLQRGIRPGHALWGRDKEEHYAELVIGNDLTIATRVETIPGCYEAFYKGIYEAVANGAPAPVSAMDARNGIMIIECAIKSHNERRIIDLP